MIDGKRYNAADFRKIKCKEISDAYITERENVGFYYDDYTRWFVESVFYRVLGSHKSYRVYAALDKTSLKHEEARADIRFGTVHHMYLLDNSLKKGLPTRAWCDAMLSTGIDKDATINNICEYICNNTSLAKFVESLGIKRDLKWESMAYEE